MCVCDWVGLGVVWMWCGLCGEGGALVVVVVVAVVVAGVVVA